MPEPSPPVTPWGSAFDVLNGYTVSNAACEQRLKADAYGMTGEDRTVLSNFAVSRERTFSLCDVKFNYKPPVKWSILT